MNAVYDRENIGDPSERDWHHPATLVIQARDEGASLREIAAVAGMTHTGIAKLLGRHLHPIARNDMDIELDGIEMAQAKHHEKAEGAPD